MTQPSFATPTDNINKFLCLFGLILIVSGIFSFFSSYNASLDRKIRSSEILIDLEVKVPRTPAEEQRLALHRRLIDVTNQNQNFANIGIGFIIGTGLLAASFGTRRWYELIQPRDDRMAELQIKKLAAEVAKLERELAKTTPETREQHGPTPGES